MENLNFNIRKNNLDDLFLNLSENPVGMENKNFRTVLSTIYELIEEEYSQTFDNVNTPFRNTDFYFLNDNKKIELFVTPKTNFEFYLKSKGSMYRLKSEFKDIKDLGQKEGYKIPLDMMWDYFCSFNEYLNLDYTTKSFKLMNVLSQLGNKLIEKLYFIPKVCESGNFFSIKYRIIQENKDVSNLLNQIINLDWEPYLDDKKLIINLLNNYVNAQIFKFLNSKSQKFAQYKSAIYFIKPLERKKMVSNSYNIAKLIDDWLDEIYIGKYDIVPVFEIQKIDYNNFIFKIYIKNKKTNEKLEYKDIYKENIVFNQDGLYVRSIIEKQIDYIKKQSDLLFHILENVDEVLSLNDVYKLITHNNYNLQKACIELILPKEFDNIIIPRVSITSRIKDKREKELQEFMVNPNGGTIKISEILKFQTYVNIGDEKLSLQEFQNLTHNQSGLIEYKGMYVLIDEKERNEIIKKITGLNVEEKEFTNLELMSLAYSGQIQDVEFDYDEAFMRIVNDINKPEEIDVPQELKGVLRKYQETGFKWLYTNSIKGFGSCIADDMGLGKTIQVISLILKMKEMKKIKGQVLIVCPTTLVGNWVKEINMFAKSLNSLIYHGPERKLDTKADVIITTFAILRIDFDEFKKKKWGMLIVDEAQNIKNPETSQACALKALKSDYRIAMTGTPVENRLTELWSIFDFINKGYLGTLKEFQKSYAIPIEKFRETKRAQKLKLCVSPFVLRRLKTDKSIINDLPEKVVIDDYCYLTKAQTILYNRVLEEIMGEISKLNGISRRGMIFKLITTLKQICNHPYHYLKKGSMSYENSGKSQKLIDLLLKIVENDEKAVIFTQYKEMGAILVDMIQNEINMEPLFFHGSLNRLEREKIIDSYQNDISKKLMILSLKAGGTGLNLTAATNVIHYDLWWNPAVEDQATDRAYRIGQNKNVMVHRLITLGTFEEKIDEIIKSKQKLADMAVFEGEKMITELSDKEIMEIFSLSA